MRTRDAGFGDEPKRRIMLGTYALSAGYYEAYYGQAQKVRTLIRDEHAAAFERFDVLVSPTSPTVAFPLGERTENPLAMYLSDLLTIPSCMAGLPGLSIPCGLSEGLPVGLQLIGPQFSENTLFARRPRARARARLRHRAGAAPRGGGVTAATTPEAAAGTTWEPVIGLEIHVQLKTRDEDVLPLRRRVRRRAEHAHVPGLPRAPRRAAGAERTGDRVDGQARPRARLRDRRAGPLPPQELLLPGLAEGLPDLPVRPPALHRRASSCSRGRRRPARRHRARAPRGGRGQERARRRRRRPDRRRGALARRLQPRRHAARRDRDRARPALRRGRQALPAAAAPDDRRARDLGRGDGEGHAARRRQRVGAPGRLERAAHAHRAQEHELVQLHRARHRGRDRAPDRASGSRAARSSSRRSTTTPTRTGSRRGARRRTADDYRYFPEPDLVPVEPRAALVERAARRAARAAGRAHPPRRGGRRPRDGRRARDHRPRRRSGRAPWPRAPSRARRRTWS